MGRGERSAIEVKMCCVWRAVFVYAWAECNGKCGDGTGEGGVGWVGGWWRWGE